MSFQLCCGMKERMGENSLFCVVWSDVLCGIYGHKTLVIGKDDDDHETEKSTHIQYITDNELYKKDEWH